MEPALVALGRFVAEVPEDAIPVDVRDRAALVLADTVGAILGGGREPEVGRLHAGAERASGPATVLRAAFARVEPWWAIVANGFAGTMLELDEGNRLARGHPGIHVLPAALAEAERLDRSGAALLAALVVGYDVAARLGASAPVRTGMHMHGVHGAVGAAAAVARLRQLDEAASARTLGVAAGLTLGTSWRTALGGATVRNAYAGVAGANGWLAADLAAAGVTPLPDMLTEIFGRISGNGFDADWPFSASGSASRSRTTTSSGMRAAATTTPPSRRSRRSWRRRRSRSTGSWRFASRPRRSARRCATRTRSGRSARSSRSLTRSRRDSSSGSGAPAGSKRSGSPRCRTPGCGRSRGSSRSWRIPRSARSCRTPARPGGGAPRRRAGARPAGGPAGRRVRSPLSRSTAPREVRRARQPRPRRRGRRGGLGSLPARRRAQERPRADRRLPDARRSPVPPTDPEDRVDFSLTEEQERYRALVREFAQQEVAPHVRDYDREERYPVEILRKMAPLGFLGGTIPEAYGGAGIDHLTMALGIEEMSRVCIHMGSAMGRAAGLVGSGILQFGTEAQKQRYLVPLARGETFARDRGDRAPLGDGRRGDGDDRRPARGRVRDQRVEDLDLRRRPRRVVPHVRHARSHEGGPRGLRLHRGAGVPGLQRATDPQQARLSPGPGRRARVRGLPGARWRTWSVGKGRGSGSPSAPSRTAGSRWPAARWGSPRAASTPRWGTRGSASSRASRLPATSSSRRRSRRWCWGSSRPGT